MDIGHDLFSPNPQTPVDKIRTAYNRAFVNWQAYWVEAYRDQSFYLNNQWTPEERRYLQQEQRPDYNFNISRSLVNMVQGYQRKHRSTIVVQSVHDKANATSTQMTKCLAHALRYGKGYYAISDAFKGALITGIGWLGLSMDYRFDSLNGDLCYDFYPWNTIIADPFWSKLDMSDCDYLLRRAYFSKEEAISKFPKKEDEIKAMQGNLRDDLFTFMPEQRIFQSQNLLAYTEYWEQQYVEIKVVLNPFNLQEVEVNRKNAQILELLSRVPGIRSYKKMKRQIKFTALLNNYLIHEDINPYNLPEYPFIPIVVNYAPEYDLYQYKLQGIIRPQRDSQIEFNKRISKATDHLDAQINTGWIIKKSKFDNPMDFYKTGQGRNIFAKTEANLDLDAKQITPTPLPQGIIEMMQLFKQLSYQIVGINEELLGMADGQVGIVEMLRQGASLVNLQDIFDFLRQCQEMVGDKSIKLIQNNWTPEKIFQVTQQPPTPDFYLPTFGKYDAVCVEGPLTETQQQLYFRQLLEFKQIGMQIPDSVILQAMPMQGKDQLMQAMQQAEQQQMQMMQAQMQAQAQDKAVVNDLLIRESQMKLMAAEEKLAKAQEDKAMTAFHTARTIKELEGVDMDNINKFIDTILKIENSSKQETAEIAEVQNVR